MDGILTTWLLVVSAKYLTVFVPFLSLCFFDTLGFSDIIFYRWVASNGYVFSKSFWHIHVVSMKGYGFYGGYVYCSKKEDTWCGILADSLITDKIQSVALCSHRQ